MQKWNRKLIQYAPDLHSTIIFWGFSSFFFIYIYKPKSKVFLGKPALDADETSIKKIESLSELDYRLAWKWKNKRSPIQKKRPRSEPTWLPAGFDLLKNIPNQ